MQCFTFTPDHASGCTVTAWLQQGMLSESNPDKTFPAVFICPGGGYEMVSEREAEPVAKEYFAAGYHTFILQYSVKEQAQDFRPLCQAAAALAHIRRHAAEWKLQADHIAVCGFSAGGHLAASLGTLYDDEKFLQVYRENVTPDTTALRPDAMILIYPVITADEFAHTGSIEHVSGAAAGTPAYTYFGLDRHVDALTPPAYLYHTAEDDCVPVENSLRFAAALSGAKVPFELHVLPKGGHGMSVCTDEVGSPDDYNARWVSWSIIWLNRIFDFHK